MPAQSEYGPYVLSPPLTSCEKAYIVFGQGSPPYNLNIIPTGNGSQLLETLPLQHKAGVFTWDVDYQPGANITFVLTDSRGQNAYSDFRVVQAGEKASCPKNDYSSKSSKTSIGGIVGGVVGALALIGVFITLFFLHRRRRARRLRQLHSSHQNGSKTTLTGEEGGGSGLMRAGTFNLGNVRFTEPSLDHLRAIDHPPMYEAPPPAIGEAAATRDEITEVGYVQVVVEGGEGEGRALPPPVPTRRGRRTNAEPTET